MIEPTASFKDNLALLPSINTLARINLTNESGEIVATIENQPGKQGSLIVYQYLNQVFGHIDAEAAVHGLAVFAEHTADAKNRPGAHPNIDRLFDIIESKTRLGVTLVEA